jgi:hypothetical protein
MNGQGGYSPSLSSVLSARNIRGITDMQIGELLNKLQKVKIMSDKSYMAVCPNHPDKNPSLHITVKEDNILLKCMTGCENEDIVESLGLEMSDLFINRDKVLPPLAKESNKENSIPRNYGKYTEKTEVCPEKTGKIIAEYDYKDGMGNLLYQVVKLEPKSFRQRHKNGGGEWVWNMDGVQRVLYHLDALREVSHESVYLVEGEKDADNLWNWGLVATTSPGGAGAWKDEYAEYLKDKKVVIIPDKDAPGFNYALKASQSLEGLAASVSVIILPGETVKDVSDWLEQGGDYELLKTMGQPVDCLTKLTKLTNDKITDKTDNRKNADISDKTDRSDKTDMSDKTDVVDITDINFQPTRGREIWKLVDAWLLLHLGEKFDLDTICRQLDIKARDDRHHVVKKLSYEVTQENLEKSDRLYIFVNKDFKSIDWVNASSSPPLQIRWPYGIDDGTKFGFDGYVSISPGDIIVIAGVSNMGKSLFCLNFLWENMDNYPCTLMGNEYSPGKFKRRVSNMDWKEPLTAQGNPKFELIERREAWKDIIRPNNINIIDWINLDDNFYKMGSIIDGIQSKLKDGIAVIAIQKAEGKGLGLGGGFSEHLASLYLSIDFERITVRKCKEWSYKNPNGEIYAFKITNSGTKFEDIHKVKSCAKCYGTGKTRTGDCDICSGKGYIEV